MKYLIIPGLNGSGPAHWQTKWEESDPLVFSRVEQESWDLPAKQPWVEKLDSCVRSAGEPITLVAHSLGCITVAHWAANFDTSTVVAALLVAPADVERSTKTVFESFCPVPTLPLPFRTTVVASANDQYASIERLARLAGHWQAEFLNIGYKGHINAQSGLGFWKEGFDVLQRLTKQPIESVVTGNTACYNPL